VVLIGGLDQANGGGGIEDRLGEQVCREASSRGLVVLAGGVEADDGVEVHDATFLIFGHLDVADPGESAQLPLGEASPARQMAGQISGEPAPQLARVSIEEDGSLIVVAIGAQRPAESGISLVVAARAGDVAAVRAAAFLVIPARPARQHGLAAHAPRVHRAEGRGSQGREHARMPGHRLRDALAAGEPGEDQLAGVLLVDPRAGQTHTFAAVAARHQQHTARLGDGVVHEPPLSGGQIDGVEAAFEPDRPGAATTASGFASVLGQLPPGQGELGAPRDSIQTRASYSRWGDRADRGRSHAAALR